MRGSTVEGVQLNVIHLVVLLLHRPSLSIPTLLGFPWQCDEYQERYPSFYLKVLQSPGRHWLAGQVRAIGQVDGLHWMNNQYCADIIVEMCSTLLRERYLSLLCKELL